MADFRAQLIQRHPKRIGVGGRVTSVSFLQFDSFVYETVKLQE
jgi:hypothetical protein